ncbi:MAG: hypothetical protein LBB47_01815 [Spirochaetaceae bacterium]|jgi:hypothetical protein|nr:hypothetical protein [Spirochaetaceae bacterium]
MAKFLAYYIAADSQYKHGKLRYITGDDSYSPNDPANPEVIPASESPPGIDGLIDADTDKDTLVFSYINDEGATEVLVCNVFTPLPSSPAPDSPDAAGTENSLTSNGSYTVLVPTLISGTDIVDWRTLPGGKGKNVKLVMTVDDEEVEVAGNPQSVIKIGPDYLLILGYDSTMVYRVSISALKDTDEGETCTVEEAIDLDSGPARDISVGCNHHGTALLTMNDSDGIPYVFGLFSNTAEDNTGWVTTQYRSTLVRYRCVLDNDNVPKLIYQMSALVGKNSTDMDKYTYGEIDYILISAIGGTQANDGFTNAGASCLSMVNAFATDEADFDDIIYLIQGDGGDVPQSVDPDGTYDIHFLAVSADGSNALLGTLTYDEDIRACWRYYRVDLAGILAMLEEPTADVNISALVEENLLTRVDSGFGDEAGYYWEGAVLNAANQLWTMKGNEIRVCDVANYGDQIKDINIGTGTLYDSQFNINCLDLIGEMLYQEEPAAVRRSARLGKHRMLARSARVARNAAKARAQEEARVKAAETAKTSAEKENVSPEKDK